MNYRSIKVLLFIAFALPFFLSGSLLARGGERAHHPAAAGHYGGEAGHYHGAGAVGHPEARAYEHGAEAGAAVGGAANLGGSQPSFYGPTDSEPQAPVIINNSGQ